MKEKKVTDLGKDNIGGLLLKLALPAILAQIINVLYNIFFAKSGEKKKVSIVMIVLAIVFICKLFFLK